MPDLPTQSVTEEKYKDENGHIVVKKVKPNSSKALQRKCYDCAAFRETILLNFEKHWFLECLQQTALFVTIYH